jgi:predicted nucleic acid-binding protein
MAELVYDTGALIAADRGSAQLLKIHEQHIAAGHMPLVPTPVVAQAWRNGARQARLARFLRACNELEVFTRTDAREVGHLLSSAKTSDVIDALVVVTALRYGAGILTSDPGDLAHLAATLNVTMDITVV